MDISTIILVVTQLGIVAFFIWGHQYIKSTVETSISHQFNVKLEEFKQGFTKELHTLDRRDKYTLAALENRLEAHQLAFALARKMTENIHAKQEKRQRVFEECNSFINTHFLYLDATPKQAFRDAVWNFANYPDFMFELKTAKEEDDFETMQNMRKTIENGYATIRNLPQLLIDSTQLHSLTIEPIDTKGKVIPSDPPSIKLM